MQCAFLTVNRRMLNYLSPTPAAIFQYSARLTALMPTLVKLFAEDIWCFRFQRGGANCRPVYH